MYFISHSFFRTVFFTSVSQPSIRNTHHIARMLRASGHQLPLLTAEAETGSREWEDFSFVVAADTQLGTAQNIVLILGFSIFVSCLQHGHET